MGGLGQKMAIFDDLQDCGWVGIKKVKNMMTYTVNNYRQVTGMVTGENFAFFIYRHFVQIL